MARSQTFFDNEDVKFIRINLAQNDKQQIVQFDVTKLNKKVAIEVSDFKTSKFKKPKFPKIPKDLEISESQPLSPMR